MQVQLAKRFIFRLSKKGTIIPLLPSQDNFSVIINLSKGSLMAREMTNDKLASRSYEELL